MGLVYVVLGMETFTLTRQALYPLSTAPAHQPTLIQGQGLVLLQLLSTGGPQLKGQPVVL